MFESPLNPRNTIYVCRGTIKPSGRVNSYKKPLKKRIF